MCVFFCHFENITYWMKDLFFISKNNNFEKVF